MGRAIGAWIGVVIVAWMANDGTVNDVGFGVCIGFALGCTWCAILQRRAA